MKGTDLSKIYFKYGYKNVNFYQNHVAGLWCSAADKVIFVVQSFF